MGAGDHCTTHHSGPDLAYDVPLVSQLDVDKKRLTRVTTSPLMTPYLRDELEGLGFEIQDEDHVGVQVGATLADCMRLDAHLRTALHVMWLLKRFRCPSPKALYTHTASFPWEELIANDAYFSVSSNVENPKITNSMYPNLVVKDAIVDRISKRTGARPDSGPDRSRVVINLYWKGDRAWIYLNTNGRRLADRGYRKMPHAAPMQETLAAAVLIASGYDGTMPLVNPMCGSGTLAIEAALIATGRAPGLLRLNFGFMHTKLFDEDAWRTIRVAAKKQARAEMPPPIVASDIDPKAIDAARKNARTAGVEQLIEFVRCDFAETPLPETPGIIVMNPEYGQRLGEATALEETYGRIGDFLKQRCAGWTGCVFTGERSLSHKIGLRTSRKVPFMNASIECRLLRYEMYEGSRTE
ncbi:MAG: class I SAM-dependent RNA methyltransferase [Planctomycetes bacterium]|nr:class I SAM-dependent RNA methyltransferase [Planctomycetota bacterium]